MENTENNQNFGEIEEVKLEMPLEEVEKDSLIKDFFVKENGATVKELASLFGQSEYELKKEFGSYKAKKLCNRLSYFIDSQTLLKESVYKEIQTADKCGFYGVTVYPTAVPIAKNALKSGGVKIRALIGFPLGEEFYKVVRYSVKQSIEKGADEVIITLSSYQIKNGEGEDLVKKVKKLVKTARKRAVSILLDISLLTPTEIENTLKNLISTGVSGFTLKTCCGVDKSVIENAISLVENQARIEWFSDVDASEDAVSAFLSGAVLLTSSKCVEVVTDLNKKINCVGVTDGETVDKTSKEEYN